VGGITSVNIGFLCTTLRWPLISVSYIHRIQGR
jgi:hypothetical protein